MAGELNFDLFEQAKRKLEDNEDKLAKRLIEAVQDAYQEAGKRGVEELFLRIRKKYVGEEYEA